MSQDDRREHAMLRRLSGDAGSSLTERLLYHGARLALPVGLAVMITVLFPPMRGTEVEEWAVGEVASEDVIAEIGFAVPKTPAELERDRREAMEAIPPTFRRRSEAVDTVVARMGRFFDQIDSAAVAGDTLRLRTTLQAARITATPAQLEHLFDEDTRGTLRRGAERAARDLVPRGIADAQRIEAVTTPNITVRTGDDEENVSVSQVLTSGEYFAQAVSALPGEVAPEAEDLFRLALISHLEYSLVYDVTATESDRAAAAQSVPLTKGEILRGEAIVRAADPIGPETLERLEAYTLALRTQDLLEEQGVALGAYLGSGVVTFMMLMVFGLLLRVSRPNVYANFRWLLLIAILTAVYFVAATGIARGELPGEWLPIAFVALPVAVLWDTRMALLLALVLGAITGTLQPFSGDYGTVLVVMVTGAAAGMSVRAVRRRADTWVSIAIIAGAGAVVSFAYTLSTSGDLGAVGTTSLIIAGNATAAALLAAGFLWVFELFTGITTEQTLLEWADHNRPLLRRLAMEAPGTYAHTNYVANLAEAAATAIGADGLLCRVGLLYHDVGKAIKPQFFVENQHDQRNPHDKLKPETSAAIVREHVTEGARLARDENVPQVIIDFILEHHGTQRIGFFFEKAREESGEEPDLGRFSYPGPKPRSKETAIAMLADSCESAVRAMQEPTQERVEELVDAVVSAKVADGQLDDCPLTLADLAEVKKQFVNVLSGVVHRRIEYPETKHLTDADEESDDDDGPPASDGPSDADGSTEAGAVDADARSAAGAAERHVAAGQPGGASSGGEDGAASGEEDTEPPGPAGSDPERAGSTAPDA